MADKREQILSRLLTVLKAIEGIDPKHVYRNKMEIPDTARPAIVLMDADEAGDESGYGRGRPAGGPQVVALIPEIYVYVSAKASELGTDLNTLRGKVLKAVVLDAELLKLTKDGDIRYQGCATGLAMGRSLSGEGGLSFIFNYVLKVNEL